MITQMPKTVAMKKKNEDLRERLSGFQTDIDAINNNDEERYRRKSDKLDNLRRDVRTLYLNKLYLDCSRSETIEIPQDHLVAEAQRMEQTSKQLLSEFNILLGRLKKEERIKYNLQRALHDKPVSISIKRIQIKDYEDAIQRATRELNYYKEGVGIEDEELLEEIIEPCDTKYFETRKEKYFSEQIK